MPKGKRPHYIVELSRNLRKSLTPPEKILWKQLRNRRLKALKFRRQYAVGRYIIDFYCAEQRLGIEIDGKIHGTEERSKYDQSRDEDLKAHGIRIVRVTARDVLHDLDGVLTYILSNCE